MFFVIRSHLTVLMVLFLLFSSEILPLSATDKKIPEAEILSVLKYLQKKEIKLRLRGLTFADQTMDRRVFDQLVKMYEVKNEIRENVYQAMVRLNQNVKGQFSPELLVVIRKEVDRLKGESPLEAAKFISSFIGQNQPTPDPHLDSFVKWALSNLDDLCDGDTITKDVLERRSDVYFALQGDILSMDKLANYFNRPTTNKHDSQIINIFISRKDPRLFKALVEEMASCNPSFQFVEL
ncbi:MAG: hypothetical protein WAW41_18380, partial [Methylobacter sp.]